MTAWRLSLWGTHSSCVHVCVCMCMCRVGDSPPPLLPLLVLVLLLLSFYLCMRVCCFFPLCPFHWVLLLRAVLSCFLSAPFQAYARLRVCVFSAFLFFVFPPPPLPSPPLTCY